MKESEEEKKINDGTLFSLRIHLPIFFPSCLSRARAVLRPLLDARRN